jgi:threonylcarbamoyladenosine tRNA methylthiotransferase MtaB
MFEDSCRFIQSLPVSQLHVFTYSERPGTQALKIPYIVDPKTKHKRSHILLDISDKKLAEFYSSQQGTSRKVLFEHTRYGSKMFGFTENYIKMVSDYDSSLVNEITNVRVGEPDDERMAMQAILIR